MAEERICGTCKWYHLAYCCHPDTSSIFVAYHSPACKKWKKKQVRETKRWMRHKRKNSESHIEGIESEDGRP